MWMSIGRLRDPPVAGIPLEYILGHSKDVRGTLTKQAFLIKIWNTFKLFDKFVKIYRFYMYYQNSYF